MCVGGGVIITGAIREKIINKKRKKKQLKETILQPAPNLKQWRDSWAEVFISAFLGFNKFFIRIRIKQKKKKLIIKGRKNCVVWGKSAEVVECWGAGGFQCVPYRSPNRCLYTLTQLRNKSSFHHSHTDRQRRRKEEKSFFSFK